MKRFNIFAEYFCPKCGQSLPSAIQEKREQQCPTCGVKAQRSIVFWLASAMIDLTFGLLFVAPVYSMSSPHLDEYREVRLVLAQGVVLLVAAALVGVGLVRMIRQVGLLRHYAA